MCGARVARLWCRGGSGGARDSQHLDIITTTTTEEHYVLRTAFICSCFLVCTYTTHIIPVWVEEIGAASTAVPSLSNIMHMVLSINADLRPVPADITCRRPDSLLTQHLQAYGSATGGHASLCSIHLQPILLSRHDNAFPLSRNSQKIMTDRSTFTFLI